MAGVETPPYALQNASHGAQLFRLAAGAGLGTPWPGSLATGGNATGSGGGVINATDFVITQNGTPNMFVNVAGGQIYIPGSLAANQGLYYGLSDATTNLVIATASSSNPRIDTVVATVEDAAYSGANNDWKLQVLTGTATAGATLANLTGAAAVPANSCLLGYVLVPTSAASIVTADLLDARPFAYRLPRFASAAAASIANATPVQIGGTNRTWTNSQAYGGPWTASSTGWAVPRAGLYIVQMNMVAASPTNLTNEITINGTQPSDLHGYQGNGTLQFCNLCVWEQLNAGDVVGYVAQQGSGSTNTFTCTMKIACIEFV